MSIAILKVFGVILLLIGFLFTIRAFGKRYAWHAEWQRKVLHVGLGLTSLSFPCLFQHVWQVAMVCLTAIFILLLIRIVPALKKNVGKSIYDVKRFSLGELLFALSIVLLFGFAGENIALYVIPITILTISDATSALVGTHYGRKLFVVIGGVKSWEGTLTFAGITCLILVVLLYAFTSISWPALFMIAAIFSVLGALIEAVSWHGFDNILIPITAYLFLHRFMNQTEYQLFYQLCVLAGLVGLGLLGGPKSQLKTHALMTAIVSLYFFWVVGDIAWLMAPILVFLTHIALVKLHHDEGSYTIDAVFSVTSGGFFWLLIERLFHIPFGFYLFSLAMAIQLQIIVLLRLRDIRARAAEPLVVMFASLLSGSLILGFALIYYGINMQTLVLYTFGLMVMFIGGVALRVRADRLSRKRWVIEAGFSLTGSASALVPIWIMGGA